MTITGTKNTDNPKIPRQVSCITFQPSVPSTIDINSNNIPKANNIIAQN